MNLLLIVGLYLVNLLFQSLSLLRIVLRLFLQSLGCFDHIGGFLAIAFKVSLKVLDPIVFLGKQLFEFCQLRFLVPEFVLGLVTDGGVAHGWGGLVAVRNRTSNDGGHPNGFLE